ncbi:MAG: acyl dehydratase [Rhodobacteraceae bacterium]|nr:acyl dehydratase [Paracoccaceae bacterium]
MQADVPATQTLSDRIDPARAAALHAVLGRDGAPPASGDPLPAFWHQVYFWQAAAPGALGADGHPATGGLIPDLDLPKRMWAGGRLTFHAPFLCGVRAERTTRVVSVTEKTGRTGPLGFVTLRHDVRQRGTLVISEEQDLVYRAQDAPAGAPTIAPRDAEEEVPVSFDTVALFRYSALTFNGHRIHYDADFARASEGYPGPVVHGPLLAQQLMQLAEARQGQLARFAFRATAPLFAGEEARLCRRGADYWVRGPEGRLCMTAEARA